MSALPLFYYESSLNTGSSIWLEENTARHIVQVLRMQPGEQLKLTDGKGNEAITTITIAEKKKCQVSVDTVVFHKQAAASLHLCIAFTKNSSRNEWLLEKATELGVRSITPLLTTRTEREKLRYDRLNGILISALLQSQQYHLPLLQEATALKAAITKFDRVSQKLLAHCIAEKERHPFAATLQAGTDTVILIGPEGDFTAEEVDFCTAEGYKGISLGTQRLRTETAAMAAVAYFNLVNHE